MNCVDRGLLNHLRISTVHSWGLGAIRAATSQSGPLSRIHFHQGTGVHCRPRFGPSGTVEPPTGTDGIPATLEARGHGTSDDGAGIEGNGELGKGVRGEGLPYRHGCGSLREGPTQMTQFLTLGGSYELTCPTADSQWIAGRLGLRAKDAGDCREQPSRHVSAKGNKRGLSSVSPSSRVETLAVRRGGG